MKILSKLLLTGVLGFTATTALANDFSLGKTNFVFYGSTGSQKVSQAVNANLSFKRFQIGFEGVSNYLQKDGEVNSGFNIGVAALAGVDSFSGDLTVNYSANTGLKFLDNAINYFTKNVNYQVPVTGKAYHLTPQLHFVYLAQLDNGFGFDIGTAAGLKIYNYSFALENKYVTLSKSSGTGLIPELSVYGSIGGDSLRLRLGTTFGFGDVKDAVTNKTNFGVAQGTVDLGLVYRF